MKIPTRDNIDRWLFDYTEGNLSPAQEELLENYLLNNPDLEVDLDAWNESHYSAEPLVFEEKEKLFKKRRIAPIYWSVAAVVVLFMSFIFTQQNKSVTSTQTSSVQTLTNTNQTNTINNLGKKSTSISESEIENSGRVINTPNSFANENVNFSLNQNGLIGSQIDYTNDESFEISNASNQGNSSEISSSNPNQLSANFNTSNQEEYQQKQINLSNSSLSNLPTNYLTYKKSQSLDAYQLRGEEIHTSMKSEDENLAVNGRHTPKILNKIERALSRDIALTNIPDHSYAIPEKSDVDVNFSNIGATSKTRFYSVSRARWAGNNLQQKFSQQLSFDFYARGIRSGFGMQANYDYYGNGVIQNWNTALIYSPKISLSRSITLEPAMRFKMGNQLLDRTKIQNNSPVEFETGVANQFNYDTSIAIGHKLWYRDLDAGLTINTSLFYIGFQASNLLHHYNNIYSNTNFSNARAFSTINLIAGTQYISRNEKLVFSPYVYADFNPYRKNYFAGFSLKAYSLMIGGSYGSNNQWTGLVGLSRDHFSLLAQSTYAPSASLGNNALTHQLTIRFNSSESRKARRYITL